jgi:polysaccharide biosynthesis/export protein
MRGLLSLLLLLELAASSFAAPAPQTAGAAPAPPTPVADPAPLPSSVPPNYRLGPGDVLDVVVPTHEGFNANLTVQPDGRLYYPFVGEIMAKGLTIPELTQQIQSGLEKELRQPKVTISMREVRPGTNRATVTGAVRAPNAVDLRENWHVSDAVAAVGGPSEKADLKHVTFWHEGQPETLDLSPLLVDGRLDHNPIIGPGDFVIIPERARLTVSVTGEGVHNQGSYEMDDPEPTVLKALQKAGGHTEKADLKHASLIRAGHSPEPLDLDALILHGDMSLNLALGNGDTVQVPVLEQKVFVFGEVQRPDAVTLQPGAKILDILSATAPTTEANLDGSVLIRKQPDGKAERIDLKLGRMKQGDLSVNLPMQNGDVVLIPKKGKKKGIADLMAILYPIDILHRLIRY